MARRALKAGDYLFRLGGRSECGYLIEDGVIELRTLRVGRAGGPPMDVVLARLGRGELVGELSAAEGVPHSVDALVISEEAVVLTIDGEQIRDRLARADPTLRTMLDGQVKRYRRMLALLRGNFASASAVSSVTGDEDGLGKFRLEDELREALRQRHLEVRYQPIQEIASGRIAGYEALVRWDHPVLGAIAPEDFIQLAEETSLIMPVGEYVLDEAMAALDALRADPMPFVAVNVSARQLANLDLIQRVVDRRDALRLPPGCVKLEITESQALDPEQVAELISHCHANAIAVSLDDFGTRYSHLTHLYRLDFDVIKIDQAFVREMFASTKAMNIVRAIVAMAQAIGADLVVEGVETAEQLEFLGGIGCRYAQGFLIGRPEPLAAVLAAR
ncbi:MAG: EAL domain-containing protein [Proteobacteria bacterium]|nr:EAL domain-containing protein [Pseudomonadota bacterium]